MGKSWKDVAIDDMRRRAWSGSYLTSYVANEAPPTGRRANGNNSAQYARATLVMGRYCNADAFNSTNPDFSELSWMGASTLADLASRSWAESIMWNHIFCSDPWGINHAPGWVNNTRVVWWDWQFWIKKKSTGEWVRHQLSDSWSGVPIVPTFESEDWSKTWEDIRTEPSGYRSVRLMYDPNAKYASSGAGYWPYHGFSGGVKLLSASGISASDVADCIVSAKVSLVLHNTSGTDDRDFSRFAIAIGADWYPTPRGVNYPSMGTSQHKLARAKWPQYQYVVGHTMMEPAFSASNGFPSAFATAAETYDPGLVGPPDPDTPPPPQPAPNVGNWFPALFSGDGNWQSAVAPTLVNSAPVWGRQEEFTVLSGAAFSYQAGVESANPAPTFSKVSGPSWLSVSSGGLITGTAPAPSTGSLVVRATNSEGSADAVFPVTVAPELVAPTITTTTLPNAVVGAPYSQQLAATGTQPFNWSAVSGSVPAGLTLFLGGLISGTPTTAGTATFTAQAENNAGADTQALSLVVGASGSAPAVTTTSLAAGTVGTVYSQALAATGTAPLTWSHTGALPPGLSRSGATISGTPTQPGTYQITASASNDYGSSARVLTIAIGAAAVVAKRASPWAKWLTR